VITLNGHGTPREHLAEITAFTPYTRSPMSRVSAAAENVS
jgi:hypothetical protein